MPHRPAAALAVLLTLAGSCTDAGDGAPDVLSVEVRVRTESITPPYAADLIFVVSDAPSMAPHHDALVRFLGDLDASLRASRDIPSLHVGVVGPDPGDGGFATTPVVSGCTPPTDPFHSVIGLPWFVCDPGELPCYRESYAGTLGEAVACVGALPATGAARPPLLARALDALDATPTFRRPGVPLVVIVVSADDDASPAAPAELAARFAALGDATTPVSLVAITGDASPRLAAVVAALPPSSDRIDIAADDWREALAPLEVRDTLDLRGCVDEDHLPDGDPAPGYQLTCVGEDRTIPPCVMVTPDRPAVDTPLPCYRVMSSVFGGETCRHQLVVEWRSAPRRLLAYLRCAGTPPVRAASRAASGPGT